jgi:hypothetical protein
MLALPEVQRVFLAALLDRERSADVLPLLRQGRAPELEQRFQIYRNNLFESLGDALRAVFPVLAQLVGEDFFRQLTRRFVRAHPLRQAPLHGFGRELPAWLASLPMAADWPYLADVAALEWAWHEVYHEADAAPLRPEQLARVPEARHLDLRLALVSAARLVASPYPVLRIWQAHQGELDPGFELSLADGGVQALLLRRALEIDFVLLSQAEYTWLTALASGNTLAEATLAALHHDPDFDLAGALGRHLALGSFAAPAEGAARLRETAR